MPAPQIRKPRFARAPTRGLKLTPRDREILRAVHRHRFLRSTHLVALLGSSRQAMLRRLGLLFHHGYLDRPPQQLDWYAQRSEPMVYALGQRGAKELARSGGLRLGSIRWDTKNGSATRRFLRHALAVADVSVTFETACRMGNPATLIRQEEILAGLPSRTRALRLPFRWSLEVRHRGKAFHLGVEPDRVFGLRLANRPPDRREVFFFLEADRGTMPVRRRGLGRSSFFRKLLAYEATWRQGIHRSHLGLPNFRVLTVTTSKERVRHLVEATRTLKTGSGLFLFANSEGLMGQDILTRPWLNGRGEEVRLLPDPVA